MHIKIELKIPPNTKVLEIGGGGMPHPRASLIIDKFLEKDGLKQHGMADLVIDRPFVHADACKMPFPDKFFDYVIASHVIEHIPEAEMNRFVSEIVRVGQAGYIEAPGPLYETLRDIPEHLWFVVCAGNTVHLTPKRREDIPPQKQLVNPMFSDCDFSPIVKRHADIWHTGMEWENSFEIQIHENLSELWQFYDEQQLTETIKKRIALATEKEDAVYHVFDSSFKKQLKSTSGWALLSRIKKKVQKVIHTEDKGQSTIAHIPWRYAVVCPECKTKLEEGKGQLICNNCKLNFPILERDIPSFISRN